MSDELRRAIGRASRLCEEGSRTADGSLYPRIAEIMSEHAEIDGVDAILRMCEGGPDLVSKSFMFPHIAERLDEIEIPEPDHRPVPASGMAP